MFAAVVVVVVVVVDDGVIREGERGWSSPELLEAAIEAEDFKFLM